MQHKTMGSSTRLRNLQNQNQYKKLEKDIEYRFSVEFLKSIKPEVSES